MKKRIVILLVLSLIIVSGIYFKSINNEKNEKYDDKTLYFQSTTDSAQLEERDNKIIVKNELILSIPESSKKEIELLVQKYNGRIVGFIDIIKYYQIEFDEDMDLDIIKSKLEKEKTIEEVSYNYAFLMPDNQNGYPNDKNWKNDWSEIPTGDNWNLEAIQMPQTWQYLSEKETKDIQIGIFEIDGLDEKHVDLKENINSTLGNVDSQDCHHGTEVSGIISAQYNNKKGISGITMNVGKIDYYCFNGSKKYNFGTMMSYYVGLCKLMGAAKENNQTAIINMSLGVDNYVVGGTYGNETTIEELNAFNQEMSLFLNNMLDQGYDFLIVKAAGNVNEKQFIAVDDDGSDITRLGYIPYITDKDDKEYDTYSSYYPDNKQELEERLVKGNCDAIYDIFSGITDEKIKSRILVVGSLKNNGNNIFQIADEYSVCGSRVDILAPGTDISSITADNNYIHGLYGTSYSAPQVTGIAALLLSMDKTLSGEDLKNIIVKYGTGNYKIEMNQNNGETVEYSYKMLNAYNTLKNLDEYNQLKRLQKKLGDKKIIYYVKNDFDDNGNEEAFVFTGEYEDIIYKNVNVYFLSSGGEITLIRENVKGQLSPQTKETDYCISADKLKFIVWDESVNDSYSLSYVYGVKDSNWYELDISGQYQSFRKSKEDYGIEMFVGFANDYSQGFHDWLAYGIIFDSNSKQFILSGEVAWKDTY